VRDRRVARHDRGAAAVSVQFAAIVGALGASRSCISSRVAAARPASVDGVVLASACGAVISVLLALADSTRVRGCVLVAGTGVGVQSLDERSGALAAIVVHSRSDAHSTYSLRRVRARSVGLELESGGRCFSSRARPDGDRRRERGTVGFVGLITPHAVRLTFRTSDHRIVAPASALLGGTLLALADLSKNDREPGNYRRRDHGARWAPLFIALLRGRTASLTLRASNKKAFPGLAQ